MILHYYIYNSLPLLAEGAVGGSDQLLDIASGEVEEQEREVEQEEEVAVDESLFDVDNLEDLDEDVMD